MRFLFHLPLLGAALLGLTLSGCRRAQNPDNGSGDARQISPGETAEFESAPPPERNLARRTARVRLVVQTGHSSEVNGVAFSPDGKRILTVTKGRTAHLWDVQTGKELRTIAGPINSLTSAAFSHDGKRLLAASLNWWAWEWDARTGKKLHTLAGHKGPVHAAVYSPDDSLILTGGQDQMARLWNAQTGEETLTFTGHTAAVHAVAFAPDSTHVLTGSDDSTRGCGMPRPARKSRNSRGMKRA